MNARTTPVRTVPRDKHGQLLFDVFDRACPSRHVLEHVTSRWGLLALAALRDGDARFSALRRKVDGISEKMLSQTLQTLERDGFVHREAQPTIPPRVDYSLTPLGRETANKLIDLIEQLEFRMPAVTLAQEQYDKARTER
jgi:DNA-binding HxlR family transcriptional regulator